MLIMFFLAKSFSLADAKSVKADVVLVIITKMCLLGRGNNFFTASISHVL